MENTVLRLAFKHRVRAVLPKNALPEMIGKTLQAVLAGMVCLPKSAAWFTSAEKCKSPPSSPLLSTRQHEILQFLAEGHSNKWIARQLKLSAGTVKTHIAKIYDRLDVHNRTQAAMALVREEQQRPGNPP